MTEQPESRETVKHYTYQITNPNTGAVRTKNVTRKYTKKEKIPKPLRELEPNEVRKTYVYKGKVHTRVYKVKVKNPE
jgi:hypothetical protein